MKAKLFFVALLMFCVCVFALYGDEEIENLLINPSLEEIKDQDIIWQGGNPGRPDNLTWHVRGTDSGLAEASIDDEDFIDGEQSIYVERKKEGWVGIEQGYWTGAQEIILEPDTTYTLAAWMKATVPGDVVIYIKQWEVPWAKPGEKTVTVVTTWAEYHLTGDVDDQIDKSWFEFKLLTVEGLWFDFAHLYKGKYVPSQGPHAVASQDKLAATWGEIRRAR